MGVLPRLFPRVPLGEDDAEFGVNVGLGGGKVPARFKLRSGVPRGVGLAAIFFCMSNFVANFEGVFFIFLDSSVCRMLYERIFNNTSRSI